jgi:hypothetical protein
MTEQNTTPELTELTERIGWIEQRMASAATPEQRQIFSEMFELTKNRLRCAELEERSRGVLPPDNTRWGASAPPPPTPQAEPQPQRPSGWRPLDPVRTPYVDACDRLVDAQDAKDRMEREREYRQYLVDEAWERRVADEQQRRKQAERRSFHKAPGDPDWN